MYVKTNKSSYISNAKKSPLLTLLLFLNMYFEDEYFTQNLYSTYKMRYV